MIIKQTISLTARKKFPLKQH